MNQLRCTGLTKYKIQHANLEKHGTHCMQQLYRVEMNEKTLLQIRAQLLMIILTNRASSHAPRIVKVCCFQWFGC